MPRNHIVSETDAVSEEAPIRAEWVIDGMAAGQSVSKDYMWGIWRLVLHCMPPKMLNPEKIAIVMWDT